MARCLSGAWCRVPDVRRGRVPRRRRASGAAWVLGVWCAMTLSGCREPRDPIVVQRSSLTLENQTRAEWTSVEIWVNNHYRVTVPTLAAGGRLNVPLSTFVAGFGQRFNPGTQVFGVEVTAKSTGGEPVRLIWGKGRRR